MLTIFSVRVSSNESEHETRSIVLLSFAHVTSQLNYAKKKTGVPAEPPTSGRYGDAAGLQVRGDISTADQGPGVHYGPGVQSRPDLGDGVNNGQRPAVPADGADHLLLFAALPQGVRVCVLLI